LEFAALEVGETSPLPLLPTAFVLELELAVSHFLFFSICGLFADLENEPY